MANQDAIWEYFQNEAVESFSGSKARVAYLANLIVSPGKVLNIGVGAGTFEAQAISKGLTVFSLDPSAKSIGRLQQLYGLGDRARVGHCQQIPFPENSFDAVVVSEVLEHLSDDILAATLSEVTRVLRPGGQIIGTVPARETLTEETVVCPNCNARFHRWGHVQSFQPERLRSLLTVHFSDVRTWERPFITFSTLNWKGKVQGFIRLLLSSFGFRGKHDNIVFVGRR